MFPQRLRLLRKERDLVQRDVAKAVGITESAIGMYEQGRRHPDVRLLIQLADFFDVSVDYLLGRTDNRYGIPRKSNKVHEDSLEKLAYVLRSETNLDEQDVDFVLDFIRLRQKQRSKSGQQQAEQE